MCSATRVGAFVSEYAGGRRLSCYELPEQRAPIASPQRGSSDVPPDELTSFNVEDRDARDLGNPSHDLLAVRR